jgi:hypothetical protein
MRKLFLVIPLLFPFILSAQVEKTQTYQSQQFDVGIVRDFPMSEYDHAAFNMTSYPKDPSAHAVVLKEFGKAWITSNGNSSGLMFEYHVKIKLFDEQALKRGHVEIPYYIQDNGSYEEINPTSVQGITYYAAPGGGMSSVELSQDSVFIVKKNKHWSAIVFTMPKLSKGCIIEYKYRLSSPYLDKFKTWEFQSDIPKVYSEFEAHIPTVFGYNVSLRGSLKLSKDTINIEKNCFSSTELQSDCNVEDYRIDNVPAFKPEPFVASPKSYMSALYFQLTKATMLNNSAVLNTATYLDVADNWADADKTLRYDSNFGSQLLHSNIPKDKLAEITSGITDTLLKAKAIYAYIQKNIAFDGLYSVYTDNGVKKAFDKHNGNSADINITLTDALKEDGINANAVLISTRNNITIDSEYPAISEFNSVITAVIIGNKAYLLDATCSLLPFGMLPVNDLNSSGWGRVMPLDKPSYWIKLSTSLRRLGTASADLTFDAGSLGGTITTYSKSYSAYEKRVALAANKISGNAQSIPGLVITKADNNAAEGSPALTETYQVQISNQDKSGEFTFVPFMLGKPIRQPFELLDTLTANPFVDETRTYPIDFGMPASYSFTVTLHLPTGYKIDTPPQNIDDSAPGIGSVNTIFNADGTTVTYTLTYSLDKAFYNVTEYAKLKALFDKIVLAEKAPLTIKKQ